MENKTRKNRGRPKAISRQISVEAAMIDYWDNGIYTKSINEMCKQLGISKPAFYREFKSEDGLMLATLKRYREINIVPMLAMLEEKLPFKEVMENALEWLTQTRGMPYGCLFTKMRLLRTQLGGETLKKVKIMELELLHAFEQWYVKGLQNNEVNKNMTPRDASMYISTQFTMVLIEMGLKRQSQLIKNHASLALSVLLDN
jgi:AcrR family transcriptional regulator